MFVSFLVLGWFLLFVCVCDGKPSVNPDLPAVPSGVFLCRGAECCLAEVLSKRFFESWHVAICKW